MNTKKITLFTALLGNLLLFSQSALAVDECGAEAAGPDIILCSAGTYASGITYNGSDGLELRLDNPGIDVTAGGVELSSLTLSSNANLLTITASDFDTVTDSGSLGALSVFGNGLESALVVMDGGSVSATGGFTSGIRTVIGSNPTVSGRESRIIINGGTLTSEATVALAQVANSATGAAHVEMHGGTVTGNLGLEANILETSGTATPNTSPATVVMDGGSISTTNAGVVVQHNGEAAGASMSVTVSGSGTSISAGDNGIELSTLSNVFQGSHSVTVSDGANVVGNQSGIRTQSHPGNPVSIDVLGSGTVVNGSAAAAITDAAGDATINIAAQLIGDVDTNAGDDVLNFQNGSDFDGAVDMGEGNDRVVLHTGATLGSNVSYDGGADGGNLLDDELHFAGFTNYTMVGSDMVNWGRIIARDGNSLTITGGALTVGILSAENFSSIDADNGLVITGGLDVNSSTSFQATGGGSGVYQVTGAVTNAGTINLSDGVAGDQLIFDGLYSTFGGSGRLVMDVLDASNTDSMHVGGSVGSTAVTDIFVTDLGLPNVAGTVIPLVTVDGASNGVFTLNGGPIVLPNVTYDLVQNSNGGWDLVATGTSFSVGGSVTGLNGTLVLQNNGGDDLTINADGGFTFATPLADGSNYAVTIISQPAQICSITNDSGTISGANITNVQVDCVTTHTVGGLISGLSGTVVLQNNGADDLTLTADGGFVFATPLPSGSSYSVSILTQPVGQTCVVTAGGSGTVGNSNVSAVRVNCSANTYTVGGSVSALNGTLVLQNNGGDDLSLNANGGFTFATALTNGSNYAVTILTQPVGQTCSIANATGTISGANVTNISIACTTNVYTIGGTVSGLSGTLVLQNNGGDDLTINADGSFTFATPLAHTLSYTVTVASQPAGQTCSIANGSGTINAANITDVQVTCSANTYTVGGSVSGLNGTLVLQNNGGDDLTINADGSFTFATPLAHTLSYAVTVASQPAGQTCSIANGSGTINAANITDVQVTCSANTYTVGGSVSGLSGTLVLQNNGGDDLTINADGGFTFATPLANGSNYAVTVASQPAGQTCSIANGSGTINAANITDVQVTCSANTYTVGGSVTGLSGTLVLQNNGGDDLTINADGGFTFATPLANGSNYAVTVATQPTGQTCSIVNGSGIINAANITDVQVTCSADTYTVGGNVSGLSGTLVLQNNGGDDLTVNADGGFTFATPLADGSSYAVTILSQPAGQLCSISNGSGSVNGGDVIAISISCLAAVVTPVPTTGFWGLLLLAGLMLVIVGSRQQRTLRRSA